MKRALAIPSLSIFLLTWIVPAAGAGGAWSYGLQTGLVEARLHGTYGDEAGNEYRPGFAIGAHVRYRVSPLLSLQPELWWTQKGAKGVVTVGSTLIDVEHVLPYVEVPVLLRVQLSASTWEPYLVAGPSFAFRTGGEINAVFGSPAAPSPVPFRSFVRFAQIIEEAGTLTSPNLNDFDWGATAGAGVVLGAGSFRFPLGVRYTRGFADVRKGTESTTGAFTASFGIEFR